MQPMYTAKVNSPTTQLAGNINATQTSIPVQDVNVLPPAPNLATIGRDFDAETILYTSVNTANNTLTGVTRGFQGTVKAWNAGEQVGRFYTAYDHDTFIANIQTAFNNVPNGAKIYGRVGRWEPVGIVGEVVSQFASPDTSPFGLAWDGTHLWNSDFALNKIYQLTTTGAIVSQFDSPGTEPTDLTWDGTHLWNSDLISNRIYRLTTTGAVVSQFASPGTNPTGLTWDGTYLWNSDFTSNRIYQLTTTGAIVSQFANPGASPRGLAWDGTHLWSSDLAPDRIYQLTTTGAIVSRFTCPVGGPRGLTWDGTHLWHANPSFDRISRVTVVGKLGLVS